MNRKFRVFVSSTTEDLGSYRAAAARILDREKGVEVIHEGEFPTLEYQMVRRLLWQQIQISDAVLFLVGHSFGGEPSATPAGGAPRRSFAQMEWDFAGDLGHSRYVLLASEGCPVDNPAAPLESEDRRALQRAHRLAVSGPGVSSLWHEFGTVEDLQRIIRAMDFPAAAPLRPRKVRVLPYPSLGPLFVGRGADLAALRNHLTIRWTPAALVPAQSIYGLGGIGKTRLAVEYAYAYEDSYRALLFTSAATPATLSAGLARLARPEALHVDDADEANEPVQRESVLQWLEAERGWLLILDNVDTPEVADAVRALLPRLSNGHVLITSRLADWTEGAQPLPLGELDGEVSTAYLLAKCTTRRAEPDDPQMAAALAGDLGGLALALEQAGAFINQQGLSFREYRTRWQAEDAAVRTWFDVDLMRYPRSVATTWQTSFEELGDDARTALRILCWLATEPTPRALFRTGAAAEVARARNESGKTNLRRGVQELAGYTLVQPVGDAVQVHRLVQEVTRARLPAPDARQSWLVDSLRVVNGYAEGNPHEPHLWPLWEPIRPHILALAGWAEGADIPEPTGRLLNQIGVLLLRRAAFDQAEDCFRRARRLRIRLFGPDSVEVAAVENNLGTVAERLDHFSEAEGHYRRALAIHRAREEADGTEVANLLNNLAALYVGLNRFDEAAAHATEAMDLGRRLLPTDSPLRATDLSNQGIILWHAGRYAEAETAYRESLAITASAYGEEPHPEVATTRSNLGLLLLDLGRHQEAESCLRDAHAADLVLFGPKHPAVGRDANNLALVLRARRDLAGAERLLRQTLDHDRDIYGPEHSEVADGHSNLGLVLLDQGRHEQAIAELRRALAIEERLHGASHLRIAATCLNLGLASKGQDQIGEAAPFYLRALAIQSKKLGPDHPELVNTLNNTGQLLRLDGQPDAARTALRRAMHIARRAFGRRHARLGTLLTNLAEVFWIMDRLGRAEKLYRAALAADREVHGLEHPEVAVDLFNLSELLRARHRLVEAGDLHRQAASIAANFVRGTEGADPRLTVIIARWEQGGGS